MIVVPMNCTPAAPVSGASADGVIDERSTFATSAEFEIWRMSAGWSGCGGSCVSISAIFASWAGIFFWSASSWSILLWMATFAASASVACALSSAASDRLGLISRNQPMRMIPTTTAAVPAVHTRDLVMSASRLRVAAGLDGVGHGHGGAEVHDVLLGRSVRRPGGRGERRIDVPLLLRQRVEERSDFIVVLRHAGVRDGRDAGLTGVARRRRCARGVTDRLCDGHVL